MKSGFIALIGRTNVGKSTLMNSIIGEKISIITDKPQTTRNRIRGIYTKDDTQLVFLDTPGIHKPKNKLSQVMMNTVMSTIDDVDAVVFMVDSSLEKGGGDEYILELLKEVKTKKVLVINKVDLIPPEVFKETYHKYEAMGIFDAVYGISAKEGKNVPELVKGLMTFAKEGFFYFPEDAITDEPERFLVKEIIREKLLMYLEQEIPHGIAVEIEDYVEKDRLTEISAVIYTEKKSHKSIIIGKGGRKLKGVGKSAREEIEKLIGTKVYLQLWVRIKENWRDSKYMLNSLGYKE